MERNYKVQLKIQKPASEVFDAVANPKKLSGYFVQRASGPLVEGTTVQWTFAEVPGQHDVVVSEVIENERIVLSWKGGSGDEDIRVELSFSPLDDGATMVQISESGWPNTPEGIQSSHGNCGGWMHMLSCLKAYLEYGINLRVGGAF